MKNIQTKNEIVQVNLTIPESHKRGIKQLAAYLGTSMTAAVIEAVYEYCAYEIKRHDQISQEIFRVLNKLETMAAEHYGSDKTQYPPAVQQQIKNKQQGLMRVENEKIRLEEIKELLR